MARNHNNEASSSKSSKTTNNTGQSFWSTLNQDLLSPIMMQLGVVDCIAFGGVCESWRSLARSERDKFLSSKQPMLVSFSHKANKNECYLTDFNGRKFKTILPCSTRTCVGSTCGYLIMFNRKTREFCLVNPITRHELCFPGFPLFISTDPKSVRGILVFSPSLSGWVLIISHRFSSVISYCVAGTESMWGSISFNLPVVDIHYFKGKVYAINSRSQLHEVKLKRKPWSRLKPLEMKNVLPNALLHPEFVSSGESLYLVNCVTENLYETYEVDLGKKEWVSRTIEEHAVFVSELKSSAAINPGTWKDGDGSKNKGRWFSANLWYFPHDCMNVNLIK
ncbi:uncharacterized protein LOC143609838 [Bidens hawaiensis]|uniref:uncharacterized protein LOC143609838 n=1 Tax=Bidens hawaiensis TaxID=980011 RepID=UPI00404A4817